MRILFIATNINTYHPCKVYPMGVGALSAFLKQRGQQVHVVMIEKLSQLQSLTETLSTFKPELVGYSVISCQSPNIQVIAQIVKAWDSSVPFICGGAHASLAPDEILSIDGVDAACIGDGEYTLLEYVNSLETGIPNYKIKGLWFKKDGKVIKNELREFIQDLDELPFFDRDCVDFQSVINDNTGILWMLVSRGCKWDCTFCGVTNLKKCGIGPSLRMRSVGHVIEELKILSKRFYYKIVIFRDDTFSWDKEWTLEFCKRYKDEFDMPFAIFSRADCLDEDIVIALKSAGCQAVWLGYESGNDYLRNEVIKKEIETEEFIEICALLNKHAISPYVLNIVGLPYETPEMFKETIEVNRRIHAKNPMFSLGSGTGPKIFTFEPFPGTQLYDLVKKEGWLRDDQQTIGFRAHVDSVVEIPTFPRKQVLKEYRRFRYNVYKGNHNCIALFYLIYDSYVGETLRRILPSKMLIYAINVFLQIFNPKKKIVHIDERQICSS